MMYEYSDGTPPKWLYVGGRLIQISQVSLIEEDDGGVKFHFANGWGITVKEVSIDTVLQKVLGVLSCGDSMVASR